MTNISRGRKWQYATLDLSFLNGNMWNILKSFSSRHQICRSARHSAVMILTKVQAGTNRKQAGIYTYEMWIKCESGIYDNHQTISLVIFCNITCHTIPYHPANIHCFGVFVSYQCSFWIVETCTIPFNVYDLENELTLGH